SSAPQLTRISLGRPGMTVKVYSTRARVLFGIGLLVCFLTCAGVVLIMVTQPGAVRDPLLWIAGLATLGGAYTCLRIIITGRATAYLEQDVRDVFGLR